MEPAKALQRLNRRVIRCKKCPRLVKYRVKVSENPPKRFRGEILG